MAEPIKISTSKYTKDGKVEVDGNIWEIKLPGAGTDLKLRQALRSSKLYSSRINIIDKKIEDETATQEDLDDYEKYLEKFDEYERIIFELSTNMLKDGTEDNSQVKAWVDRTPSLIIEKVFEDIENQSLLRSADGQEKAATSSK